MLKDEDLEESLKYYITLQVSMQSVATSVHNMLIEALQKTW